MKNNSTNITQGEFFFNTINLTGEKLKEAKEDCNAQEKNILAIMPFERPMTPFEVLEIYNNKHNEVPITSIRRAMTGLTNKGHLQKTKEMKDGKFGKPNYCWMRPVDK